MYTNGRSDSRIENKSEIVDEGADLVRVGEIGCNKEFHNVLYF